MILRSMPDKAGGALEQAFAAAGEENHLICASARSAALARYPDWLSIKSARNGSESYLFDGARLLVDDHVYLIVNGGRPYGSEIRASRPVASFSVFFRPGLAGEVYSALFAKPDGLLTEPARTQESPPDFYEHLFEHDELVSPVLRYIESTCRSGFDDPQWYEEQSRFLLQRMYQQHLRLSSRMDAINAARRSTRLELFRRLMRATDFMHCSYDQPLTLEDIAACACLAPQHFLCVFKQVFGITPYQFVLRKRVAEARRLLAGSKISVTDIAARIGFESRTSFFRCFRNATGVSPQAYRGAAACAGADF